ncbi:hypothetical protein M1P97_13920, partial [Parabacteroides sp. GYB001]|uniref:BACON domain-containing protein n=1 Tax=Parabacteroides leei TaxID=2939491 RepID=UPI00293E371B
LNSTERTAANISVKAGNITKPVAIKQSGSTFSVSKTEIELENTVTSGSVTVKGTDGLPWTVSPSEQTNGITPATSSSTATGADQTLTFNATANTGGAREATFTVAVPGGNHSKTVKVKQKDGLTNAVMIDQALVTAYKEAYPSSDYPPFNYDHEDTNGSGSDYKGNSSDYTISIPYTVEVESTQSANSYRYSETGVLKYCRSKGTGWRVPTAIELFAMYTKCKGANEDASDSEAASSALGAKFIFYPYWSSSVSQGNNKYRVSIAMGNGLIGKDATMYTCRVRCVRDI